MISLNEKEQKILDASLKLFVEKGFHGTSTAKISETAGVSTGTLFHYFKTKEELIDRLYIHTKESLFNEINNVYDDEKNIMENMRILWLKFVYLCIDEPYKFQFLLTFRNSPNITSLTKKQIEIKTESILETYSRGIEKLEIKTIPFELVMTYFWCAVTSAVNYFGKHPEDLNKKNLDMVFELFWNGLSNKTTEMTETSEKSY